MGIHEEQTPKDNQIHQHIEQHIAQNLAQTERVSSSPIEGVLERAQIKARPLGHGETFTVVYFMPDGDAIIRYQKIDESNFGNSFHASQAFAIIKVVPSINGSGGSIEFLKCRFDVGEVMQNMANAYLKTNDETKPAPKTFPISD